VQSLGKQAGLIGLRTIDGDRFADLVAAMHRAAVGPLEFKLGDLYIRKAT
jgi:hypothetical protein